MNHVLVTGMSGVGKSAEKAGRRPAVVLSPAAYNRRVGLALLCPITSRVKGYPFDVVLPDDLPVHGAVLCDQLKSLDWRVRCAERMGTVPAPLVAEILMRLVILLTDA